jgi:hypothetical protein
LLATIRIILARDKHSSLFFRNITDQGEKFANISGGRTNSSEQRHRYDREFQKAAGFIAGMCCPFVVLLYMSFYLVPTP